jgi:hypothetical protein
MGTT